MYDVVIVLHKFAVNKILEIKKTLRKLCSCQLQWPRSLRHRSAVACPLRLWVRTPLGGMDVCLLWMLCVLRSLLLCVGLITRPEVCYRLWCVSEYDLEPSWMGGPCPTGECCVKEGKICCSLLCSWQTLTLYWVLASAASSHQIFYYDPK